MLLHGPITTRYRDFAAHAREESPCFAAWALGVADDPEVHAWLADLPRLKQQPNLVFAAARRHGAAAPAPYEELKRALMTDEAAVKETIRTHATQTNEVGRLATLMPVLATLDGSLTLVEAGASAGLCLFPDRYDYAWPPLGSLAGSGGPTLTATVEGAMPVPVRPPHVAQRVGVDLHPLDVYDEDAMAWLELLVWPEQDERRAQLRTAIEVTRSDPPDLCQGNLLRDLPGLVEDAGRWGTPVVFHTAVAAYLDHDDRARFHEMMTTLVTDGRCHWVSNEGPQVLPQVTATGPDVPNGQDWFVLALDGRTVAWTRGHGQAIRWL
ncbi:MAG: DUF2332 domain-containing protein [Nocardioidaceae bacterium]